MILVNYRLILLFPLLFLYSCNKDNSALYTIYGETMGTSYSVIFNENIKIPLEIDLIKNEIDSILVNINNIFSSYIETSEITKVNNSTSITFSPEFTKVFNRAYKYYYLSDKRYDVTVSPLIKLWGFYDINKKKFPSDDDINKLKEYVGLERNINFSIIGLDIKDFTLDYDIASATIRIDDIPYLEEDKKMFALMELDESSEDWVLRINKNSKTKIDLNSIAKGYAVDVLTEYLYKRIPDRYFHETEFLIEIGGEVRAHNQLKGRTDLYGVNTMPHKDWIVGIQNPNNNSIIKKVKLNHYAMATSGTYNNYFLKDGIEYSHIINPKTGYPIKHNILSATVIAPKCIDADALATMLMVIPWEEGIDIINQIENTSCYIILKDRQNFLEKYSVGFEKFIVD